MFKWLKKKKRILTQTEIESIKNGYSLGMSIRELAREFNVHESTIYRHVQTKPDFDELFMKNMQIYEGMKSDKERLKKDIMDEIKRNRHSSLTL